MRKYPRGRPTNGPHSNEEWSWSSMENSRFHNHIQLSPERSRSSAIRFAAECFADVFDVGAVLHSKRERDRRVARISVGRAVALVVVQEQLADAAVGVVTDRRRVMQLRGAGGKALAATRSACHDSRSIHLLH